MSDCDLNNYTFGQSVSSNDSEAIIPPLLRKEDSYQPLTTDRLERKNQLDKLLDHQFTPGENLIDYSRSISHRDEKRPLHNEDNSRFSAQTANKRPSLANSNTSISQPNLNSDALLRFHDVKKGQSNRDRDDSLKNTETVDSSRGHRTEADFISHEQHTFAQKGPPRRFSQLVRLSVNHITMGRTRKHRKNRHQSYAYIVFAKLSAIAARVVHTRTSEPEDTQLSVNELVSLSKYLYALKYGENDDSASTTSSSSKDTTTDEETTTRHIPSAAQAFETIIDSSTFDFQAENDRNKYNKRNNLLLTSNAKIKKHFDTENTPLYTTTNRGSLCDSASSESMNPTENDPLLPCATSMPNYSFPQPFIVKPKKPFYKRWVHSLIKYVKYDILEPILSKHPQQLHKSTQIRFEGWSLFIFSPSSITRFFLWKIIGSSQFELFILSLLFIQWCLLSLIPIRFKNDDPFFTRPADYVLLIIHVIYTLEALSKILVYGLFFTAHFNSRPTLSTIIQYLHQAITDPKRESDANLSSRIIVDDINSTSHHHLRQKNNVPAYVTTKSVSSGNDSLPNASLLSVNSGHINRNNAHTKQHLRNKPQTSGTSASINSASIKQGRHVQDEEDVWSIMTTAERQVRASISYNSQLTSSDSEYDEEIDEFLKVNHKSYLSSIANIVDLVSIICYWIDVIVFVYYKKRPWSILQALAAMRLFRFLVVTEGTAVIMNSLRTSYDMLKNVLGFFIFFWLLFSLIAVFIFMGAFSRRCAVVPTGQPLIQNMTDFSYVEPRISCSGYKIDDNKNAGPFDINTGYQHHDPGGDGLYCKIGQVCIQDSANRPGYGYISFENIFFAMLNMMTVISTEDWTDLLYITQDSVSEVGAAIFYSFCIYLMSFIMVPMFIAVITTSFAHARGDVRDSAFSLHRKAKLILTVSNAKSKHHFKNGGDTESDEDEEWVYSSARRNIFYKKTIFHGWAHYLIQKTWFSYLANMLVAANLVFMMLHDPKNINSLSSADRFFAIIFALEILIRIMGRINWKTFWKSHRNRFDLIIALAAVLDEIKYLRDGPCHLYLMIFKVLRSYRVAYLFPGVLGLVSDVLGDGQGLINLTFFTFLVLFLLAPISVQLFGGDFSFVDNDEPSMKFDNSYQAFLALFQIMTGENWTDILYNAMHSQEHDSVTYAALFIVFLYFAVHYMVLNLFIAVIMENFDLDDDEIKQIQIKKYIQEHRWKPEYFKMDKVSRFLLPLFFAQDKQPLDCSSIPQDLVAHVTKTKFHDFLSEEKLPALQNQDDLPTSNTNNLGIFSIFQRQIVPASRPPSIISFKSGHSRKSSIASQYSGKSLRLEPLPTSFEVSLHGPETIGKYNDEYELNVAKENKAVVMENLNKFRSLGFLTRDSYIRKFCTTISSSEKYRWFLSSAICISALLAFWADEHNRKNYPLLNSQVVEPLQSIFLVYFCIDTFIHMTADGVLMLPKSYLRNLWNCFDILNLLAQMVFTALTVAGQETELALENASYLRMLRAFRSMRLVYYVPGMRAIFLDVIYGLPKMVDAVALNFLVFITFAIYGCHLFSGKFALCNDDSVSSAEHCYGEFFGSEEENNDMLLPRVWRNPYSYSFDTFGESLLHLFECASGEGWIASLFSAMSTPQHYNEQPQFGWESHSIFNSLFYVAFMFVASLCSIQLFIGVFLEIFKQRSGISSLTNTQRQFQDLQRQLALIKPTLRAERPESQVRAFFYDLISDKRGKFARFMSAMLALNILVLATEHFRQPLWLTYTQNIFNMVFLSLYVFEIGSKIMGFGLSKWASAPWNIYDSVLVGMTIGTSIPKLFMELSFEWNVARKLFMVGIAFRLAQRNESLNTLFKSAKRALPSIFYVSTVFSIVIICFGVTFQEHFSTTKYGPYGNEHANFRTLFNSILTLFRITTGENWDFLMHDFAVLEPECVGYEDCGSPKYAYGLFIVFYVMCTFIFVNLFTVIVIDNFSFTFDKRNQFTLITRSDLRKFKEAWSSIDQMATGYIHIDDIPKFLRRLEGALSLRIYGEEHSIAKILEASNHVDNNFRHFVSFPLSERYTTHDFAGNYMQQSEQYFNVYKVNECLSTINALDIKEKKKQYTLIYQEIIDSATYRGVAFQRMLEILSMRLIDASKSLTFDELVNRARIQDRIHKELAMERAKGLIAMIVQRREYVKSLKKAKYNERMSPGQRRQAEVSPPLPIDKPHNSNPVIQLRRTEEIPPTRINGDAVIGSANDCRERVPTIVIDQPQRNDQGAGAQNLGKRIGLSINIDNPRASLRNNKVISAVFDESLGTEEPYSNDNGDSIQSPSNDSCKSSSPKPRGDAVIEDDKILGHLQTDENNVFIKYYSIEESIDKMTISDAKLILSNFKDNAWSELLHSDLKDDELKK